MLLTVNALNDIIVPSKLRSNENPAKANVRLVYL